MKMYTREEIQEQVERGKAADRQSGARHRKRTAAEKAKWRKDHELDLQRRRAEIDANRQHDKAHAVALKTPDQLAAEALAAVARPVVAATQGETAGTIIERRNGTTTEIRSYRVWMRWEGVR